MPDAGFIHEGFTDDEHLAALFESLALFLDVGIFHAGPRFDEGEGGGGQIFRHGNEHRFAVGRGDDALVEQDVFLERAFKVVAEGGVGVGGGHPAVIGLHEVTPADVVARDLAADFDDAQDGFVAGDGRFVVGDVVGHLLQSGGVDAGDDGRFAGVAGELFPREFEVGEAEADYFDSAQDLV